MTAEPVPANGCIGILGGGQLGRMLALAAAPLGYRCHIFCPEPEPPAAAVADRVTTAAYDDIAALDRFVADCDVVTYEFENIPLATVEHINGQRPVRPGPNALAVAQDRLAEKRFATGHGARTADYVPVDSLGDLADAAARIGLPAILKTRRLGYDGKGQAAVRTADDIPAAWAAIGQAPAILEQRVDFDLEISVIAARDQSGRVAAYPPVENQHVEHILKRSVVPADIPERVATAALALAPAFLEALDYVGVLAIELFVCGAEVLVNEFAPRVHNSGHWSIEGAATSQFEQHLRAICGLPLGEPRLLARATMENLIGDDIDLVPAILREPGAHLHLYGKREVRPGRKMGHVTRLGPRRADNLPAMHG